MCYSMLVEQDLKKLSVDFAAEIDHDAFARYTRMSQENPKKFKLLAENPRIYPNYFAPIVTLHKGQRLITPMRYRVRPHGSDNEVPSKYNMFNARIDSLQSRQSWKPLFMRQHGLLAFQGFYEWVARPKGKQVILIRPQSQKTLAAPIIFDTWISTDKSTGFASFAVITRDPPKEVLDAGHDRCPITLEKGSWDSWLRCEGTANSMIQSIDVPARETFSWANDKP